MEPAKTHAATGRSQKEALANATQRAAEEWGVPAHRLLTWSHEAVNLEDGTWTAEISTTVRRDESPRGYSVL